MFSCDLRPSSIETLEHENRLSLDTKSLVPGVPTRTFGSRLDEKML